MGGVVREGGGLFGEVVHGHHVVVLLQEQAGSGGVIHGLLGVVHG